MSRVPYFLSPLTNLFPIPYLLRVPYYLLPTSHYLTLLLGDGPSKLRDNFYLPPWFTCRVLPLACFLFNARCFLLLLLRYLTLSSFMCCLLSITLPYLTLLRATCSLLPATYYLLPRHINMLPVPY